jgi:hypothetical protein
VFRVGRNETYWDAIMRLAEEVGWRFFVDGQHAYYDDEMRFIVQAPVAAIRRKGDAVVSFSANWDQRKVATECTLELICNPFEFRAGQVFQLEGFGPASSGSTAIPTGLPGRWLIDEVTRDRFDIVSEFKLIQPTKPKPEPRPEVGERQVPGDDDSGPDGGEPTGEKGELTGLSTNGVTFDMVTFGKLVAGEYGKPIEVSSSYLDRRGDSDSNHSEGKALDLSAGGGGGGTPGPLGDGICTAVLVVCGFDRKEARRIAKENDHPRHNFSQNSHVTIGGNRHTVEIGWRTWEGKDHWNHVHIGFDD